MTLSFGRIKQKALFILVIIVIFSVIYRYGTDASDWSENWRPTSLDNIFFALGTTVTADTAGISPVSSRAKLLVMLQMLMVIVILLWDL